MNKQSTVTIIIPRKSEVLRDEIQKFLAEKYKTVKFLLVEGDVDSSIRIVETDNFEGPALWESVLYDVKRIERALTR